MFAPPDYVRSSQLSRATSRSSNGLTTSEDRGEVKQAVRQLFWIQGIAGIDQPVVDNGARSARQKCRHVGHRLAVQIAEQLPCRLSGQRFERGAQRPGHVKRAGAGKHRPVEGPVLSKMPRRRQRPRTLGLWSFVFVLNEFSSDQIDRRLDKKRVAVAELQVHELTADVRRIGELGHGDVGRAAFGHEAYCGRQERRARALHSSVQRSCFLK